MTAFTVTGTFTGRLNDGTTGAALAGTVDITGGTVVAMDLTVSNMPGLHFTEIYSNMFYNGSWLLSGNTPGSCECFGGAEDYITFNFASGPTLQGFTQTKITGGAVVHNTYGLNYEDYLAHGSSTTYYGLGLTGTICPDSGCAPWPILVKGVPGPVAGAGASLGLALIVALLGRAYRHRQNHN